MGIFYFLWGDPPDDHPLVLDPEDSEDVELQRRYVLEFLETRFAVEAALRDQVKQLKESWAKEFWTVLELLPHVPPEAADRINVDRKVNELDPDFSFYKAVFNEQNS